MTDAESMPAEGAVRKVLASTMPVETTEVALVSVTGIQPVPASAMPVETTEAGLA